MREALLLAVGRLVCTSPWFVICCVPFYPHRRVSRGTMAAVITGASVLFFLCNFFLRLYFEDFATYGSLVFPILYLVMAGLFIWGFQTAIVKLLYVFLLVQAVSTAINYTAAILLRPFYPGIRISLQSTPAYTLAILLITMALFPALWHFFTHHLRKAMSELHNRDFMMLSIPPVLMFAVTLIFSDLGTNPAIPQGQAMAIFLLITATGLVTYYINVRLALDTAHRIRMETDMAAMERQIAVQAQSYATLTKSIEAARAARHDLRHHLAAMSAYLEQGDMDGLLVYLAEYRGQLPAENDLQVCGNYAVDVVVRYYLQQAKEAGAELDVKLELPADIGILDTDLIIVFGNLFENAAQSVAGQIDKRRFVSARCGIEHGKLILTVDNSIGTESLRRKKSKTTSGIGQTSVQSVAEKYHGTARFEQVGDVYRASVLLIIPKRTEVKSNGAKIISQKESCPADQKSKRNGHIDTKRATIL